MGLFSKIKETGLTVRKKQEQEVVVTVPDIKEYLVKEYERVNDLKLVNERLEQELEQSREVKLKYDAALVTLDEYSKRLDLAERNIERKNDVVLDLRKQLRAAQDEINSYKIKFNDAAITEEEIRDKIVNEVKAEIVANINNQKGNLSKKIACEVINATILTKRGKSNEANP